MFSQLLISQSQSSSKTTDISKQNFWFQMIYFETSEVLDKRSCNVNESRKFILTIFFDIRRYFEISEFKIIKS